VAEPDEPGGRGELARKIALLATLPGIDAAGAIAAQRDAAALRLAEVESAPSDSGASSDDGVSSVILRAAESAHARAEIEWLDAAAAAVAKDPVGRAFPLSVERPRRGRPRTGT
jgi:hypothetical protein